MQISSMTGFARQSGSLERENFSLSGVGEIKSVNGKNLDLKVRLPLWLDEVSLNLRNIAASCFERGSLCVTLDIALEKNEAEVRVNRALLDKVTEAALTLYRTYPEELARPSVATLLFFFTRVVCWKLSKTVLTRKNWRKFAAISAPVLKNAVSDCSLTAGRKDRKLRRCWKKGLTGSKFWCRKLPVWPWLSRRC